MTQQNMYLKNRALTDFNGISPSDSIFVVGDGTKFVSESGATARTSLGVSIGSQVQAFGAILDDLNTLTAPASDGQFIVATGAGVFAYESATVARTSLGVGEGNKPQFAGTKISNVTEGGVAGLNYQTAHETHTLAAASTSVTTTIDIPTGALLLGASFNVNTAVTDTAGDDSWTAAFSGGDTTALGGGAPTQNTKVNTMIAPAVAASETNITFTPNGGNFSAGIIEVVAYYIDLTSLANV